MRLLVETQSDCLHMTYRKYFTGHCYFHNYKKKLRQMKFIIVSFELHKKTGPNMPNKYENKTHILLLIIYDLLGSE